MFIHEHGIHDLFDSIEESLGASMNNNNNTKKKKQQLAAEPES
jgi:hypothetical protein